MKSIHSIPHTIEDADKLIGHTIVQTMSNEPLLQRVGIIISTHLPFSLDLEKSRVAYEIYWQPSLSMPLGRPYRSSHFPDRLGDYYLIEC